MFHKSSRNHHSQRSVIRTIGLFLFCGLALMLFTPINKARAEIRPELIDPINGVVLDNGCENRSNDIVWNFFWREISGATHYQLYVIGDTAENPIINRSDITNAFYEDRSAGSYIIDSNRFRWRWYVRAVVNGAWTQWSEPGLFDVESVNTDCR
jgi:hypothetical protein